MAGGTLVALYLVAIGLTRVGDLLQKSFLSLNGRDDFLSVTQKLGGPPATDHSQEVGATFYRELGYPDRRYTVILMGADKSSLTYVGTMDRNWHRSEERRVG